MSKIRLIVSLVFVLSLMNVCRAERTDGPAGESLLAERFRASRSWLPSDRMEVGLGITSIYQTNARGGTSTHARRGRHSGSYDLEMAADLWELLGLENGSLYVLIEGGWPNAEGIDASSVGSAAGVNADAIGNDAVLIKESYYQHSQHFGSGGGFTMMLGKIDFAGVFDASTYADDETSQFLNSALVDDPTIPFPDYSLGVVLTHNPTESWYVMAGATDVQADGRETGFRTTFHGEDYFLFMLETGLTAELELANEALPGAYRVGLWNDPQPKANSNASRNHRDDVGFYLSCDQMLTKENAEPEDSQGLAVFVRCGYASGRKNDIAGFWSVGFQYQGIVEGRDEDVLGAGLAQSIFSDSASGTYTEDHESAIELYYNIHMAPWASVSPSMQYIADPGGNETVDDAVVVGVRAQVVF